MKDESGGLLTYRGVVYPWQCDHIGHMNVMWYTGKFDEATWNLLAACGITARYIRDRKRGMAAVQQNTTYKKELMTGDVISVRTTVLEVRNKVVRFRHDMFNDEDGQIVASSELTGVHMNQETRKSTPFPEDILKKLQSMLIDTAS